MIYPPVDHFPGGSPWVFHIFLEQFTPGDLWGSAQGLDHGIQGQLQGLTASH